MSPSDHEQIRGHFGLASSAGTRGKSVEGESSKGQDLL